MKLINLKYVFDFLFIISLIILFFIPSDKQFFLARLLFFLLNVGIEIYLIVESHKSDTKISRLEENLQKISPRKLSNEQKEKLAKLLSFESEFQVALCCRLMDNESFNFAEQIADIFRKANWKVGPTNRLFLDDIKNDVTAAYTEETQIPTIEKLLLIFIEAGLRSGYEPIRENAISGTQPNTIYLIIGSNQKV